MAELDVQLAEHLPKAELDTLLNITNDILDASVSVGSDTTNGDVSIVTGRPASSARRVVSAQRANLLRNFKLRRSILKDSLTSTEVAEILGSASRQTAHDRTAAGTLLAIRDGGRMCYPIWQFDPEGPDGVVEGLSEVQAELPPLTQLGRLAWFVSPRRGLGDRTPIDALQDRDVALVIAEARASHTA